MQDCSLSRPIGRREARREERRDAILDVAACSFLEHGYAATTMSGIAGTLGGSKGTLWNYFPSKELLFGAVLDRATRAFREELETAAGEADGIEETLFRLCESFIDKMNRRDAVALFRLVIAESTRFPELGRIFYERGPRRTHELVSDYLARAMEAGTLRRADPLHAAQYLLSLCNARSQLQLLTSARERLTARQVREHAADAVGIFLRAYAPACAPGS